MRYRAFGGTGISLSEVGLGAHMFPQRGGAWYEGYYGKVVSDVEFSQRRATVARALELGINLIAVEDGGDFTRETDLTAQAIGELGARHRVHLLGLSRFRPEDRPDFDWGLWEAAVDEQLKILRTNYIDILEIRFPDSPVSDMYVSQFGRHAGKLKASGKVRAFAAYSSDAGEAGLLAALASGVVDGACRALGFLNPGAMARVLPEVVRQGLGFIGFVPFQKGWFFECATEAGLVPDRGPAVAGAGLRWCLQGPGVTSVLVGLSSIEDLEANCAAVANPGIERDDPDLLQALTRTPAYDRLISAMSERAPQLVFDWRRCHPFDSRFPTALE